MTHEPLQIVSPGQLEQLEIATARYESAITEEAGAWLTGPERGLEVDTVRDSRLGVVDDPIPGHEKYEGWISIPYLGVHGEVLKMRFRRPPGHPSKAKYLDAEHATPRAYNVKAINDAEHVLAITEGEFDCMMLGQLGIPAIAVPGAQAWKPHYRRMLAGFSRIWVFGDPDEAGHKMISLICSQMRQARGAYLKGGDITDVVMSEGPEQIFKLMEEKHAA